MDLSEDFYHRSLKSLLLDKRIDGAVKELVHRRWAADIGLLESFLVPDVDVSHNKLTVPPSGDTAVAESKLQMEVFEAQAFGDLSQALKKL